jgi:hypothetical protein
MSTLRAYNFTPLALGLSPADMQNAVDGLLTAAGWQRIYKTIVPVGYVSSTLANAPASQIFDGYDIDNSNDAPNLAYNGYVGVQLSSAAAITHCTIFRAGNSQAKLTGFVIESSNDGAAWTVCGTYTPSWWTWNATEGRDFAIVGAAAATYWRVRATSTIGPTGIANQNWDVGEIRFFTATGDFVCGQQRSYFIPPSTELVGNSVSRGVLAIVYTGVSIQFIPEMETLIPLPPIIFLANSADGAGAVTCSVTIGGATISITGAAGNSSQTNLRLLFEAIRASADATFKAYTWTWQRPAAQNADDTQCLIFGVKTVADAWPGVSGTNITAFASGGAPPMIRLGTAYQPYPVTITPDLINGCVLFYQISNRAVSFAMRTNTAYTGPIHAAWSDHAKALACMPTSLDPRLITPIELVVGTDDVAGNSGAFAYPSHCWGLSNAQSFAPGFWGQTSYGGHPILGLPFRGYFTDGTPLGHFGSTWAIQLNLYGSALFAGADSMGNDFQIHAEKMIGTYQVNYDFSTGGGGEVVVPALDIPDWYKFVGSATNEALSLVSDIVPITTLNQAMDNTTAYTSLALLDATAAAAQGVAIIEDEAIPYGAKSGNTLTSTTRTGSVNQFGTPLQAHAVGDPVYQGLFFTVINGGALYAGTTKPV